MRSSIRIPVLGSVCIQVGLKYYFCSGFRGSFETSGAFFLFKFSEGLTESQPDLQERSILKTFCSSFDANEKVRRIWDGFEMSGSDTLVSILGLL